MTGRAHRAPGALRHDVRTSKDLSPRLYQPAGPAVPSMGNAVPSVGDAVPSAGYALPRAVNAVPRRGPAVLCGGRRVPRWKTNFSESGTTSRSTVSQGWGRRSRKEVPHIENEIRP